MSGPQKKEEQDAGREETLDQALEEEGHKNN
ncbi:rCG38124, partial [Rattus norvegicus]